MRRTEQARRRNLGARVERGAVAGETAEGLHPLGAIERCGGGRQSRPRQREGNRQRPLWSRAIGEPCKIQHESALDMQGKAKPAPVSQILLSKAKHACARDMHGYTGQG